MKKILCVIGLSAVLSMSALADGDIGNGGKTCTNCFVNPATQVETSNDQEKPKPQTEIINDYFFKMLDYFTEIAF